MHTAHMNTPSCIAFFNFKKIMFHVMSVLGHLIGVNNCLGRYISQTAMRKDNSNIPIYLVETG